MPTPAEIRQDLKRLLSLHREAEAAWRAEDDARRQARKVECDGRLAEMLAAAEGLADDVPTPTPTPVPPTPTPVPGTNLLPYPALPAVVVAPGTDLAKLGADSMLPDGEYTTSGDIKRNVVAQNPGKAVLRLKAGQCPRLPDLFAGVRVVGGGKKNSDELKTAGPICGELVHSCEFVDSEGFGLLTSNGGKSRVTQCLIQNNGSGGIGGTGSGMNALVDNCRIFSNNLKYKRTNSNKFTRGVVECRDNVYRGNAGVDVWADNYVQFLKVSGCQFSESQKDRSGDRWTAANIRGEISQRLEITGCYFHNDTTAALSIDEMRDGTLIKGNTFDGAATMAIELRNDARDDFYLENVRIEGNTFKTDKLNIVPSGNITRSKQKIVVTSDNLWPDGSVSGHVKIPA
jgi:hypothetical protein